MPASAAAAPSTWGRVSSTVTLVTAVLAVMLMAFALPQLHLHPHKIPIAIAGPAPAAKALDAQLEAGQPGGFDVTTVPNAAAARARILDHEDYGAIVAGTSGLSVFTASAASPAVAQLIKNLASALQATRHTPVPVVDVSPLPAQDPAGAGLAASAFPLVLGGWIAAVVLMALVRGRSRRLAGGFALSIVGALTFVAIEKFWFGTVAGNYFLISAGVALGIAATTWTILGLRSVVGNPGLVAGAVIIVLIGNPLSGLTTAPELLPTPWGTAGQYLPPGASASLLRSTAFFHGHGGLHPALVLTAWMAAGVALYLLGEGTGQRRSRQPAPVTATEDGRAEVAEA